MNKKRPPLVTAKRIERANAGGPQVLRGSKLAVNAAIQQRYAKQIGAMVAQMTSQVRREVMRVFETPEAYEYFATDASLGSNARIKMNSLSEKFNSLFARKAKNFSEQMLRQTEKASTTSVHSSLQKLSGGLSLKTSIVTPDMKDTFKAIIAENVGLIKSIANTYLEQVQGAVMRSIANGNGLQDLIPALEKYEGMTHRRAHNMAIDQTRKAYNNVSRDKMQTLGVEEYVWNHSGGSNQPREDHIEMDGETFRFDAPPVIDKATGERGIPGQAINCRCTMTPIFRFDENKGYA
jgi:SPP1 gp7 family putative phage head morphogenesis protein